MAEMKFNWVDNPTASGIAECNTDVLNDCLMHLKYDNGGSGTGLQMFDTILKDHVLTYEETKGLALQGTYVYKEALAGSRYGYPDFYAKCLEEYQNATIEKFDKYLSSNISFVGSLGDAQGVLSGFTASNYAKVSNIYNGTANTAEFVTKVKITDFHGSYNDLFKPQTTNCPFGFNSAGKLGLYTTSSWVVGSTVYPTNTSIWVKVVWDGTSYKIYGLLDNSYTVDTLPSIGSWTLEATWTTTTNIWSQQLFLGNSNTSTSEYFNGTIDLNETYININNSRWWTGTQRLEFDYLKNANGHLFYDIANKDSIDEHFNQYGTAWFYGVDTENERIFLPRDKYFSVKGVASVVGNGMAIGLVGKNGGLANFITSNDQNITYIVNNTTNNNVTVGTIPTNTAYTKAGAIGVTTDPTKSGIEAHLESNQDKLLYICVGNTTNYEGVTDVVNQGMEILEQVNQGIESRVAKDSMVEISEVSQELVSWCIPDYTAGISVTWTDLTNYTAPADGVIMFEMYPQSNRSALDISVNGVKIPVNINGPQNDADTNCALFFVGKGDVVTKGNTGTPRAFTGAFYPLKGAK